jgi:hypothetical protein
MATKKAKKKLRRAKPLKHVNPLSVSFVFQKVKITN